MGDKIDEVFEILGNNRKSLILAIIGYVIIMLIVIAIIWWPKDKDYATYEKINVDSRKTEQAQNYVNTLSDIFKNSRKNELKTLISNGYIQYTEKTSDQIISELDSAGYFSDNVEINGVSVYTDGDTYVYSTTLYNLNNKRTINIIETYPYKYEIVFDDFYSYEKLGTVSRNQNIRFTINSVYKNLKYIQFNMQIENLNDTYVRFDFNSSVGVQAVLEDGTKYSLANAVSQEQHTNIESNMTVNKNFVFEIPAQLQEGIEYIVFNGVSLKFSEMNIKVSI